MATILKAQQLLATINDEDIKQVESQYKIARLLSVLRDANMHEELEYDSFAQMVQGETHFSYQTASEYCRLYNNYTRLKYTKREFLKILRTEHWRGVCKILSASSRKLSLRAISNAMVANRSKAKAQFNFLALNDGDITIIENALSRYGMQMAGNYRSGMSAALVDLIKKHDDLLRKEGTTKSKTKLKAAA